MLGSGNPQSGYTLGNAFGGPNQCRVDSGYVFHVTKSGVVLPPQAKYQVPKNYVENKNHEGSYGVKAQNGKYCEKLRIDKSTEARPSHYHRNGGEGHLGPSEKSDPGFY